MKPDESPADGAPGSYSPVFRRETPTEDAPTQVIGAIGRDTGQRDTPRRAAGPSYQQRPDMAQDLFQPVAAPPGLHPNEPGASSEPSSGYSGLPNIAKQPIAKQPIAEQPLAEQPIAEQPLAEQPIAQRQSGWLRPGTEVFQTSATQFRSQRMIGIAVLVVVVLGLVGATVAYFLTTGPGRTGNPQLTVPQPAAVPRDLPSPPAPRPPPVDAAHALIDPPGQSRAGGGMFDLPALLAESSPPLAPAIVKALQAGGMTDGVLKATTTGSTTIGLFALTLPDQHAATTVAQGIATAQLDGGLKADDNRAMQGMAVMASAPDSASPTYRAVYVLYNRAIFVDVSGPNRDAVQATFDALVKQQVTHAPPTVRVGH